MNEILKTIRNIIIIFLIGAIVGGATTGYIIYRIMGSSTENSVQYGDISTDQIEIIDSLGDYFSRTEQRDKEIDTIIQSLTSGVIRGEEAARKLEDLERENAEELRRLREKIQTLKAME